MNYACHLEQLYLVFNRNLNGFPVINSDEYFFFLDRDKAEIFSNSEKLKISSS